MKLDEEYELNKNLNKILKDKEGILTKRALEIEELDKNVISLERAHESLQI